MANPLSRTSIDVQVHHLDGFDRLEFIAQSSPVYQDVLTASIVFLPEHLMGEQASFPAGTLELLDALRTHPELNVVELGVDDDTYVELSRHGGDFWLPVIWVAEHLLFPVILGIVSNYVYGRLRDDPAGMSDTRVNAKFRVARKPRSTTLELEYHGPAASFERIVREAGEKALRDD